MTAPFQTPIAALLNQCKACVVGFHAPKGTGKDTTAQGLDRSSTALGPWWEAANRGLYRTGSFAAPLYQMVATLTGLTVPQLHATKDAIWTEETTPMPSLVGKSPRWLLEYIGTEFVRDKLHPDHWVQLMAKQLRQQQTGISVITDVRFANEVALCDIVVELRREGIDYDEGHVSRKRLPPELITHTIWLSDRRDNGAYYDQIGETIISLLEEKRAGELV